MRTTILLAAALLASCQTLKPDVETQCFNVGSVHGVITMCALPAGMICFLQEGKLINCVQMQDPVLRADRGR